MKKTRKLVVAGCLCAAMAMSTTAFAMPGATSLVTVETKTPVSSEHKEDQKADSSKTAAGAASLTAAAGVGTGAVKKNSSESAAAKVNQAPATEAPVVQSPEEVSAAQGALNDAAAAASRNVAQAAREAEPSAYENIAVSTVNGDEDYVNIRDEASVDGEILGKIYNHCAATIEETVETEDGTWYKIHSGSVEGYIKSEYFVTGSEAEALALEIGQMFGYVEEGGLRVRREPNTTSEVLTKLWSGETYTVLEEKDGFVKLSLGDDDDGNAVTGYVAAEYVDVYIKFDKAISREEEEAKIEEARRREAEAAAAAKASTREAVVAYAKQFIGNPYVWGGTSLTRGTDCSGFTRGVLGHFGYGLSRTSREQAGDGKRVPISSVEPGDLIFYASGGRIYHVAMYIGGGRVIHAIDEAHGIGISSMYCMTPYCAVDVIN